MVAPPSVSVIVPAFNSARTIGPTLDALLAQDLGAPYEVIVVDDGSEDGTGTVAEAFGAPVRVTRQRNAGPAAARTLGARLAVAPVLAFTDADCVPQPAWLRNGTAALDGADLVQGQVLPDPASPRGPFDRTITIRREYGLYEAANLFVTKDLFERLGGFEDWLPARIGKPLAEDVWFGWRARRAGARTAFAAEATVHHAVFERDAPAFIAERLRLVYFPAMVRRMPELRDVFLRRRLFVTPRSGRFDIAVAAVAGGFVARRAGARRAAALALLASVPYARAAVREAGRGGWAPFVLATDLAADVVGLGALGFGSVRWRTLVL